jgi:hypothetical protein
MHVGMVPIPPMWWPIDQFWHLHHVEFDVNFTFFWKINEVTWKLGWNTCYFVATKWVLFPSLLSLVSNSGSCWKFMQLHEKMVEIHPIWWPLDWFCSPTCWVWCQIQLFVENICKLHEKMVEICLIWWPPNVFWLPFMYWIKSRIKIKVWNYICLIPSIHNYKFWPFKLII